MDVQYIWGDMLHWREHGLLEGRLQISAHLATSSAVPEQVWLGVELLAARLDVWRNSLVRLWRQDLLENLTRTAEILELLRIIYILRDGHAGVLRVWNLRRLVGCETHCQV